MYSLKIKQWDTDERYLIDNGAYFVMNRKGEVKIGQWQNYRATFVTEAEDRPGEWSETVHRPAGWIRIDQCELVLDVPKVEEETDGQG